MARNKESYFEEGQAFGRGDYEGKIDVPFSRDTKGWQVKAFFEGYDNAKAETNLQKLFEQGDAVFKMHLSGMREVSAQRKRELRKRGIVCQYLYTTANGKARYGWTKQ